MAISLNLVVGISGELSLGHAGFMSVGAFLGTTTAMALKDVVASRYRQTKGATEYERKIKTMKSVCSRGYEPALVRRVLSMSDTPDIDC